MIRAATADDFDGVFACAMAIRQGSSRYLNQDVDRAHFQRCFAELTGNALVFTFVACGDDGTITGYLFGSIAPGWWSPKNIGTVLMFGAQDGSGSALINAFEQEAAERGCSEVVLGIGYGERNEVYQRAFARKGYALAGSNFYKEIRNNGN